MTRSLRVEIEGDWYHVISRGIERGMAVPAVGPIGVPPVSTIQKSPYREHFN
ncbi:MAG TPA: hypothetical protein VGM54_15995 [Chthoniobacter sp.]